MDINLNSGYDMELNDHEIIALLDVLESYDVLCPEMDDNDWEYLQELSVKLYSELQARGAEYAY